VLGGGTVVAATDGRLKRFKERVVREASERLAAQGDRSRSRTSCSAWPAAAAASCRGWRSRPASRPKRCAPRWTPRSRPGRVACAGPLYLDVASLAEVADELAAVLHDEHARQPLHEWADLAAVRRKVVADEAVVAAALSGDRRFETPAGGACAWPDTTPASTAARTRPASGCSPPSSRPGPRRRRSTPAHGLPEPRHRALVDSLRAAGEIVAVGPHLFSAAALARLRRRCARTAGPAAAPSTSLRCATSSARRAST
jgi:hypothetical protein